MRLVIYIENERTICRVKPKELLEMDYDNYSFIDVIDNLVEVGHTYEPYVQHLFSHL